MRIMDFIVPSQKKIGPKNNLGKTPKYLEKNPMSPQWFAQANAREWLFYFLNNLALLPNPYPLHLLVTRLYILDGVFVTELLASNKKEGNMAAWQNIR